jgi:DNA primase
MDSDIEKIKDRLNIVDIVGQYVQLKRAGKNFSARCPFHKERTASFYVSPERGTYICFGCGEKGDIFSFVERMEGIDFSTALKQLAGRAGVKLARQARRNPHEKQKEERLAEACEAATVFFEQQLQKRNDVITYLRSRGVQDETSASWRLGYAPAAWEELSMYLKTKGFSNEEIVDAGLAIKSEKKKGEIYDRFRGRIMFPINNAAGQPIAFSGRFFEKTPGAKEDGEPAKYVNSPETALFKKSKTLYGFDRAKGFIRKADCVLLVEGQFDLILSHQSGLPFAVALSGTALTPEHLTLLSRLSRRLVLALDADPAGIKAGLKSAHMAIGAGFDVKVPTFPPGKDPADVARENPELLKAAIRTSQTAVEFFLNALWPTARDERSYQKIIETHVLPLIAAMESSIEQEHFTKIVAERLGVSHSAVRHEVSKLLSGQLKPQEELPEPVADTTRLSALERTAGMLIFYFDQTSLVYGRLQKLLGAERVEKMKNGLSEQAERLRFKFESEMGEFADEAAVVEDLFKQLESTLIDEEIAAAKGDAKKIGELVRRKHELL